MFYVHLTPRFLKASEASQIKFEPLVKRLQDTVTSQPPGKIPFGEPLGLGFYRFRQDPYRLIGRLINCSETEGLAIPVVCLVDVVHRGGNHRYGNLGPEQFEAEYKEGIVKELPAMRQASQRFVAEKYPGQQPPQPPQPLPEQLERWCLPWQYERTWPIFHSEAFELALSKLASIHYKDLYQAIVSLVDDEIPKGELPFIGQAKISQIRTPENRTVHYVLGKLEKEPLLFLLDLSDAAHENGVPKHLETLWQLVCADLTTVMPLAGSKTEDNVYDAIARRAKKAYPSLLVYDEELWSREIEGKEGSELALSSEELRILERALGSKEMPLFLEGRAGSGKTTTLCYYFAEVIAQSRNPNWEGVERWLDEAPPLFITQSEELCRVAREQVEKLAKLLCKRINSPLPESIETICQTFHQFCLAAIAPERRKRYETRTRDKGYLNLHGFRALYTGQGVPKAWQKYIYKGQKISGTTPELLWFVIRSYIKGHSLDEDQPFLDQDGYKYDVPQKAKHISQDIFNAVYTQVWKNWYAPLTMETSPKALPPFWDDQDLVREVLRSKVETTRFASMVCDESQDFTRVEMMTVLRGLAFANYDLTRISHGFNLPLFLAGDPFQTINPSGFRWEGMKDTLQRVLSGTLLTPRDLRIYEKELQYNYRNHPPIARLANAVQLMRKELLNYNPEPQIIWNTDFAGTPIARLILETVPPAGATTVRRSADLHISELLKKGMWCIVPEEPDEAFWKTTLEQVASPTPDEINKSKIYTPERVKGLEQEKVVLLGFGAYFAHMFRANPEQVWQRRAPEDDTPTSQFQLEYFLNRLYVAVTRAQHELTIVDTPEGFEKFWNRFYEKSKLWLEASPSWKELTRCELVASNAAQLAMNQDEFIKSGKKSEELAKLNRDASLYLSAAQDYQRGGRARDAERCTAFAQALNGELTEAAERMRDKVNDYPQAAQWFWEGQNWSELVSTAEHLPEKDRPLWASRLPLAKEMCEQEHSQTWLQNLYGGLQEQQARFKGRAGTSWPTHETWQTIVLAFAAGVKQVAHLPAETATNYWNLLNALRPQFPELSSELLADIAFIAERMPEAVRLWEADANTAHVRYAEAKARCTAYPENLKHWNSARQTDRILKEFADHQHNWATLDPDQRDLMRKTLHHARRPDEALIGAALDSGDNFQDVAECWKQWREQHPSEPTKLLDLLGKVENYLNVAHDFKNHFRNETDRKALNQFNLAVSLSVAVREENNEALKQALREDVLNLLLDLFINNHAEFLIWRVNKLNDVPKLWNAVTNILDPFCAALEKHYFADSEIDLLPLKDYCVLLVEFLWEVDGRQEPVQPTVYYLRPKHPHLSLEIRQALEERLYRALGRGYEGWLADRDNAIEEDKPYYRLRGRTASLAATLSESEFPDETRPLTDSQQERYLLIGRVMEESWRITHAKRYYEALSHCQLSEPRRKKVKQQLSITEARKSLGIRKDEFRISRPNPGEEVRDYYDNDTRLHLEYDEDGVLAIYDARRKRAKFDCLKRELLATDKGLRWEPHADETQRVFYLCPEPNPEKRVHVELHYDLYDVKAPITVYIGKKTILVMV